MTSRAATEGTGPRGTLRIIEQRVYRGPNYWSYEPTIKLIVDLGQLEEYPTNKLEGFTDRLLGIVPGVAAHSCGTGRPGGFEGRLREGTWLGHVAEHIALQLQRDAGHRGRPRQDALDRPEGSLPRHLLVRRGDRRAGRRTPRRSSSSTTWSRRSRRSTSGPSSSSSSASPSARPSGRRPRPSSTRPACATSRGSASARARSCSSGHGIHQKRIRATMTSQTGALGVDIAQDKKLTNRLLAATGVPVPRSEVVRGVEEAAAAGGADRVPGGHEAARRQPRPRRDAQPRR